MRVAVSGTASIGNVDASRGLVTTAFVAALAFPGVVFGCAADELPGDGVKEHGHARRLQVFGFGRNLVTVVRHVVRYRR